MRLTNPLQSLLPDLITVASFPQAAGVDLSSQLEQTLVADPNNSSHHFNLGIHLWKTGEAAGGDESKQFKERAAEHFLASTKLNPSDSAAFWMLGNYYGQVLVDSQWAANCYQRVVTLNPDDAEAGRVVRFVGWKRERDAGDFRRTMSLFGVLPSWPAGGGGGVWSFSRAIELEDSKVFSLIESGNILLLLSSYRQDNILWSDSVLPYD